MLLFFASHSPRCNTAKHFSNYFRNFLLKIFFFCVFVLLERVLNWKRFFLLLLKVPSSSSKLHFFVWASINNGEIFNLFPFSKALLALNYHMQDKKRSKKIISEKISIFECASFLQLFSFAQYFLRMASSWW